MKRLLCWSVRNVLDLHLEGRLSGGWSRRAQEHLKSCADCRAAAKELARPRERLAGAARIEAPAGLAESILKKWEQGGEPASAWAAPRLAPEQLAALLYLTLLLLAHAAPGVDSQAYAQKPPASPDAGGKA